MNSELPQNVLYTQSDLDEARVRHMWNSADQFRAGVDFGKYALGKLTFLLVGPISVGSLTLAVSLGFGIGSKGNPTLSWTTRPASSISVPEFLGQISDEVPRSTDLSLDPAARENTSLAAQAISRSSGQVVVPGPTPATASPSSAVAPGAPTNVTVQ